MAREPSKALNRTFQTRNRAEHIDYDYISKLSDEDQAWLARFSDEYYGASFDINPTYVLKTDFLRHFKIVIFDEEEKLISEDNEKLIERIERKITKYTRQLEHYQEIKVKYLQISDHKVSWQNVDLRKVRSITKFYKKENGKYTEDTSYKYSSDNIQVNTHLKACNDQANAMRMDMISNLRRNEVVNDNEFDVILEDIQGMDISAEERIILEEMILEERKLRELD